MREATGRSMNRIITIGREFGSGGREVGKRLSEALGIAYYDREIVEEIAKRPWCNYDRKTLYPR